MSIMQSGIFWGNKIKNIDNFYTGLINGLVVEYEDTDSVKITQGSCLIGNQIYSLSAGVVHDMTSLASGFDYHYLYIDVSESTPSSLVFIDSTDEPTFSVSANAWFNGEDKMIGVVQSPDASATILTFSTSVIGKLVRSTIGRQTSMALNQTPDGNWQIPNVANGGAVTPVNAIGIEMSINGSDTAGNTVGIYATNKEMGDIESNVLQGCFESFELEKNTQLTGFIPLGVSRDVYLASSADDNDYSAWLFGFEYTR